MKFLLGQNMIAWVDKRLHQATTYLNKPFGVLLMVTLHNYHQLVTVHYLHKKELVHSLFANVVILDQVIRQSGTRENRKFSEILSRLHNGQSTESDRTVTAIFVLSGNCPRTKFG